MRVLISGSHSFIGNHLVKTLKERDAEVHYLDRSDLYIAPANLTEIIFNIRPDYIYLLHAYGNHYQQTDIQQTVMANYFATFNVLNSSSLYDYKGLVYVSSSSVLQDKETFYSATKAGAERLCRAYQGQGKPISIVRPFSVYGPGEADFRFIPTVFRSCLTGEAMDLDPNAYHDWIYVESFVDALLSVKDTNKTFNIRTGIQSSNQAIVDMIEVITAKKANIRSRKQLRKFDSKEWKTGDSKEAYVWQNKYMNLEKGLIKYYEYYKEKYI